MNTRTTLRLIALALSAGIWIAETQAQTTAFTYQGRLLEDGVATNGVYDLTFTLYGAPTGGAAVGTSNVVNDLAVTGGLVAVVLDFGAAPFNGAGRWLQMAVRPGASTGVYTPLAPRQPLTSIPYATRAGSVADNSVGTAQIKDGAITGAKIAGGGSWGLAGNAGTSGTTSFIGTTDNQPLVVKANNRRMLQLRDVTDAGNTYHTVNSLGGAAINFIGPDVKGATIAGGGQDFNSGTDFPNDIRGDFGFIGGGSANFIDTVAHGVIGGGSRNVVQGGLSTIAGGDGNNIQATAATIGGGQENSVSGIYAAVAGGFQNNASGQYATVAGGAQNANSGFLATIGGGSQNKAPAQYAVVAGGSRNAGNADTAVIGGGDQNTVNGTFTTISGGRLNYGWSVSDYSAIGGGFQNTVYGDYATIPGGYKNFADGLASFAGGYRAYAAHDGSFVWGDAHEADFVSTAANQFCIRASGGVVFETFSHVAMYSGVGTTEANRYFLLLNSPRAASASGLKAGGILCADSFNYANPGKNNLVVKGTLGVGYPDPAPYTLAVNGNMYSLSGYSSSDGRRKKNVETLPNALEVVLRLRGVSFEWRREEFPDQNLNAGRQIGLIAQEVEQVLPEVVSADTQGNKAIAYQNLVPVLVEAIKEQQKMIEKLEARLQAMKTEGQK